MTAKAETTPLSHHHRGTAERPIRVDTCRALIAEDAKEGMPVRSRQLYS
jgi:hypothetical protein